MPPNDDHSATEVRPTRPDHRGADEGTYSAEILSYAHAVGLDRAGVCDATVLERARREINRRRSIGLADSMQFTFRNPDRSTDPTRALADARSIVVGARRYVREDHQSTDAGAHAGEYAGDDSPVRARVARYARVDHYGALRASLELVADRLRSDGHRAMVFVDENDIVDREVAWKAGIGWFGKSANILIPGGGSWYVLGSVVTSAELQPAERRIADGCGSCHVCIDACPTAAIVADGVIDARRCLAWLIQKGGVLPFEFRVAVDDRLYGCDDCQDTCPPNVRFHGRRSPSERLLSSGIRPGTDIDAFEILAADDHQLMERFGQWYIADRNPAWLRRNALIILGNVAPVPASDRLRRVIMRYLQHDDPYLRAHAVWASARLDLSEARDVVAEDASPLVREELRRWSEVPVRGVSWTDGYGQ